MSNHARRIVDHLSAMNEVLFYTELELRELPTLSGHASLTSLAEEGMCKAHDIGDDVQTSGRRRSSAARGLKRNPASMVTLSRAALPIMVGLNGFHPALAQYGGLDARDLFSSYKAMSNHARQIVDHLSALNEVLFYAELELRELPTLSGHASLTSLAEEGMCKAHDIGDDVQTSGRRRSSAARGWLKYEIPKKGCAF
ncbi:hypothetical protein HPB51_008790 [Rhipicephalus microplus]|uniref:Uncharacterized protein n=1 Tax=Rhipicephalus microplus TaxID=6941 RepID=A0A9J6EGD6_RHIMP|nr:hypothetical protein HPB51_008790 [Rhipicephalus microplus]